MILFFKVFMEFMNPIKVFRKFIISISFINPINWHLIFLVLFMCLIHRFSFLLILWLFIIVISFFFIIIFFFSSFQVLLLYYLLIFYNIFEFNWLKQERLLKIYNEVQLLNQCHLNCILYLKFMIRISSYKVTVWFWITFQ